MIIGSNIRDDSYHIATFTESLESAVSRWFIGLCFSCSMWNRHLVGRQTRFNREVYLFPWAIIYSASSLGRGVNVIRKRATHIHLTKLNLDVPRTCTHHVRARHTSVTIVRARALVPVRKFSRTLGKKVNCNVSQKQSLQTWLC